jgi:arylsulfatase A-like enzyme
VDTFASVLGMLGIEAPRDWKQEGVDFSPRLRGQAQPSRDTFFAQYDLHNHGFARMRAARNADWKWVSHFESHMLDEFYDLAADPDEKRNLLHWGSLNKFTPEQKQAHAELDGKLNAWMESISDPLLKKP